MRLGKQPEARWGDLAVARYSNPWSGQCRLILLIVFLWGSCSGLCSAQRVVTVAGTGVKGFSGDGGLATDAQLNNPFAVARGPDGLVYVCDVDNHRIRRIATDGTISTYAGCERRGYDGDGGQASKAALHSPYEMAWDGNRNLYFVDIGNHTVRRIDAATGVITTVAGNGSAGFGGDGGPAQQAILNQPHSLAFAPSGDLFVCDILNHRIRRIDSREHTITTWAGNGQQTTSPDGTKLDGSSLHGPRAIAFDSNNRCWLALREGNALLEIDVKSQVLRRVAGTGASGFSGNGGPALEARLAGPKCVALDGKGHVYLADTESHSIRFLDTQTGTLDVLVGDGNKGDGPARDGTNSDDPKNCRLARPHGVFVDHDGSIWIGDSENHKIRVYRDH